MRRKNHLLKRPIALALMLLVLITSLAACKSDNGSSELTVTDMLGREVKLSGTVDRIVALSASDCEIVYALEQGDKLVGRGEYCDWPEEALAVDSVQSGEETNIEQIIALEPDLVLMNEMAQSKEQVAQLESANIPVVICDANTIEEVYSSIELIGSCIDAADKATALVDGMKKSFEEISKELPEDGGSVYFEASPLEFGLWTAGSNTFMDEIAGMLKLENIFADIDGWAEVSQEQIIERSPDYIVTITMYFGEGQLPEDEIVARDGWEKITAVENGKVFRMNSDELSRPGPRLVDGATNLRELIYG